MFDSRRRLGKYLSVILLVMVAACANPFGKAPPPSLGQISVVGVLPVLVDAESTIEHPAATEVVQLLERHNEGREKDLIKAMEKTDRFFDVRPATGAPHQFFGWLLEGTERKEIDGKAFRSYRFNPNAAANLLEKTAADALLVVVLQGVKRPARQWDRTGLNYLEAEFNLIQAVAILVDGQGRQLWIDVVPQDPPFLFLQHPDFDAAYYNRSDRVPLRFLTLSGLDLALTEGKRSLFSIGDANNPYRRLAEAIAAAMKSLDLGGGLEKKQN